MSYKKNGHIEVISPQQAPTLQQSSGSPMQTKEADIRALAELTRALDKKVVMTKHFFLCINYFHKSSSTIIHLKRSIFQLLASPDATFFFSFFFHMYLMTCLIICGYILMEGLFLYFFPIEFSYECKVEKF